MPKNIEIKGSPDVAIASMESYRQFRREKYIQPERTPPQIKLEIARSHLNEFDDFIASACDDIYNWLVEDSCTRKKRL